MSEEQSFEQMLNESFKTIRNGEVVEGTVLDVKPDVAYLNIGYKSDGILSKEEYSNENVDLTTKLTPGDKLEVKVLKVNDGEGQVILTYKRLAQEKGNKRIEEAFNSGENLDLSTNVQFGEGGAGTFSDGKLTTGTKSPFARHVLQWFVDAGAPDEILWQAKPHVGTDVLKTVVRNLRDGWSNKNGVMWIHGPKANH